MTDATTSTSTAGSRAVFGAKTALIVVALGAVDFACFAGSCPPSAPAAEPRGPLTGIADEQIPRPFATVGRFGTAGAAVPTDAGALAPLAQATHWLGALRQGATTELAEASDFPFQLRDTGTARGCPNRATSLNPSNLDSLMNCLLDDALLMEELRAQFSPAARVLAQDALPAWAADFGAELTPHVTPVEIELIGDGITFSLILLVSSGRVQGVWKDAQFHPEASAE